MPARLAASASAALHFQVGRDREGFWIAVESHGRGGGYFSSHEDALRYARFTAGHAPGARDPHRAPARAAPVLKLSGKDLAASAAGRTGPCAVSRPASG